MKLLEVVLLEGGAALPGVSKLTQAEAKKLLPKLKQHVGGVLKLSPSHLRLLGSAGKRPKDDDLSGDVDLAVKAKFEDVAALLPKLAHDGVSHRVMRGINVCSFAHPCDDKLVQVDLMPVASVRFAAWASQAHRDDLAAGLKGSHRNELFFATAKHAGSKPLENDGVERYFYDLHRGLMRGTQRRGKVTDKVVVSRDPDEVTRILFGGHLTGTDVETYRGTLGAINSPKFPHREKREEILKMAYEGMRKKGLSVPD